MKDVKQILVGYANMDFTGRDGKKVEGVKLYTLYASNDVDAGQVTGNVFLRPHMVPENLSDYLGAELEMDFDQKGKLVQVEFPKAAAKPQQVQGQQNKPA